MVDRRGRFGSYVERAKEGINRKVQVWSLAYMGDAASASSYLTALLLSR